ncbi:hypothetical protein K2173_025666 [Erythroxylum novogranatense]|uniref:Uncharacterized protein n=1 Tax=Erythroxylum novogranatense TaxID=1862640 RepID=A0AAV8SB66_9ROSI|nr:hypothetical protein K2173_025666 [Erythroxylum novogranatense]
MDVFTPTELAHPQRAKHKSTPSLVTLTGGQATTYTRLPLREDFTLPLLDYSPQSSSVEVKLSDSDIEKMENETEVFGVGSDFDEEEEEVDYEILKGGIVNIYKGNGFGEEEGVEIDEGVKEKGVPAVMHCFDSMKIYMKVGDDIF